MSDKLVPTLLTLVIVVVLFALIWWGWRGRVRRQSDVAEVTPAPRDLMSRATTRVDGMYVVTTYTDQPLERIARHGLGVRTNAEAVVAPDGVFINRQGAPDVFIPRHDLRAVSTTSGMVGKFVSVTGSWCSPGTSGTRAWTPASAPARARGRTNSRTRRRPC